MRKIWIIALVVLAAGIGFSAPSWAGVVIDGIGTAARYVYETHLIMMMDAESIRIGCFG